MKSSLPAAHMRWVYKAGVNVFSYPSLFNSCSGMFDGKSVKCAPGSIGSPGFCNTGVLGLIVVLNKLISDGEIVS